MNTSLFSESPLLGTFKFVAMYKLKFLFKKKKKKLHINPNQNSTKAIIVIFYGKFENKTQKIT